MMKRFLLIAAGILGCLQIALADTTWVSGTTGGDWTIDGSPYMIEGTASVDEELGLTVHQGVEILFFDSTGFLSLKGNCTFLGALDDSVKIVLGYPTTQVNGHNSLSRNVRMSYVSITGSGHVQLNADSILLEHVSIFGNINEDWISLRTSAQYTEIHDSYLLRGTIEDGDQVITNVGYTGSLHVHRGRDVYIDSFSFVPPEPGADAPPGLGLFCFWPMDLAVVEDDSLILRNLIVDRCDMYIYGAQTPLLISNFSATQFVNIVSSDNFIFENSNIEKLELSGSSGIVRNNIIRRMTFSGYHDTLVVRNNTFANSEPRNPWETYTFIDEHSSSQSEINLINNIFYSEGWSDIAFNAGYSSTDGEIEYNLVWGMDSPWGRNYSLSPTNIIADPIFDPSSQTFEITYESPVIDAGHPLMFDPDGTRSDIGAFWWDHRYDHPPVITTPSTIETRWGEQFDFTLTAVDEGTVRFPDLPVFPPWMHHRSNLDESSAILFSGIIPFGANSFDVTFSVIDEAGQRDRDAVHVNILPRSELTSIMRGRLTADYSPYHTDRIITIPAGDTLFVDPGVHVQFDSVSVEPVMIVEGVLVIAGSELDSVYFESANDRSWRGIQFHDGSSSLFMDYCVISDAAEPVVADYSQTVKVRHSRFARTDPDRYSVKANAIQDTVHIEFCLFESHELCIDSSKYVVQDCRFEGGEDGWGVATSYSMESVIRNCDFVGGNCGAVCSYGNLLMERCLIIGLEPSSSCIFTGGSYEGTDIDIRHNTMVGCGGNFLRLQSSHFYPTEISVYNNIFMQTDTEIFDFSYSSDTTGFDIRNNCFWDFENLFDSRNSIEWSELGANVIVNINGDSTDIYGNMIADPTFADTLFTLPFSSSCVDAGRYWGGEYWGRAPDIGFWEFFTDVNPPSPETEICADEHSELCVYPNPANASITLTVQAIQNGNLSLRLYNLLGQIVDIKTMTVESGRVLIYWDLAALASGRYFIIGNLDNQTFNAPLLILK